MNAVFRIAGVLVALSWTSTLAAQQCFLDADGIMYCETGDFECVEDEFGDLFCPETPEESLLVVQDDLGNIVVYDPLDEPDEDRRCFENATGRILCPVGYLRCYEDDRGNVFCPFDTQRTFLVEGVNGPVTPLGTLNCVDDNCSNFPRIPVPPELTPIDNPDDPGGGVTLNCGLGSAAVPGDGLAFLGCLLVLLAFGHRRKVQ
ncbi:MAG: hypothetical protein HYV27_10745 [Candidatus Hydrogenedentes bacterium]|nr:hypothetical protein [Candidatus Hydrogenedentota bacterium]